MTNRKSNRQRGNEAEELACAYLESKGWTILERNYFFERSEVDIVAYDQKVIVFVEVKMRTSAKFGRPVDSIDDEKVKHVYKASEAWLYERKMEGSPVRYDVVGILQEKGVAPSFNHIEDAFR